MSIELLHEMKKRVEVDQPSATIQSISMQHQQKKYK